MAAEPPATSSDRAAPSLPATDERQWLGLPRGTFLTVCLLLIAAAAVAYYPAWGGGFIWDDDAHVTRPDLRSLHGLWRIWFDLGATQQYYPLLHSAFWVQHRLWGDAAFGYHMVNILLHGLSAVLVAVILRRLAVPGAYLAAGIFALHPVCVESVAWITELKNTLSAAFYLGAFLAYLHFDEKRQARFYFAALGLFVLGLLSKTVTATLPAALLVVFWWRRGSLSWRRDILPLLPFFMMGAAAGLFTAWVERTLIKAEGAEFDLSLLQRVLLAGRVVWFYLGKIFCPTHLAFIYPRWEISTAAWSSYLYPAGALILLAGLWAIRRLSRAPLAAMLFFVGTLFPVLGFFNVYPFRYSFVADHFQYLACLGVIVLASAGIAVGLRQVRLWDRWEGRALCGAVLLTLAVLAWQQARMYRDIETLWQTTIIENPTGWLAHTNLGNILYESGKVEEALKEYETSARLFPGSHETQTDLGNALARVGRLKEALEHHLMAVRLRPDFPGAHFNLAVFLDNSGRLEEAVEEYQKTLRLAPDDPVIHANLGVAFYKLHRLADAVKQFQEALRLSPRDPETHYKLGIALTDAGRIPEAVEQFQEALRLKPDFVDAWNRLDNLQKRTPGTH